jgi:hypothetical protein
MGVWIRRSNLVEKAWLDSSLREYDPTTTSREGRSTFEEGEMTKDQALRLAWDALKDIGDEWGFTSQRTVPKRKEAIACLRLVIDAENISSKPMAWEQFYPEMGKPKLVEVQDGQCKRCTDGCPACDARKLPEQEPVAWFSTLPDGRLSIKIVGKPTEGNWEPLYTTPPQRTWIGLTEDEVFAVSNTMPYGDRFDFAEAIEAKFKEKNA